MNNAALKGIRNVAASMLSPVGEASISKTDAGYVLTRNGKVEGICSTYAGARELLVCLVSR